MPEAELERAVDADAPRAPGAHLLAVPLARDPRADPRQLHRRPSATSCLLAAPFVLLRFRAPEYEMDDDRGIVRWRIRDGLLVARAAARATATWRSTCAAATATTPGYAPGRTSRSRSRTSTRRSRRAVARWFYTNTQSRIHVIVTHGFLRSLARLRPRGVGRRPLRASRTTSAPPSRRRTSATRRGRSRRAASPRRRLRCAASRASRCAGERAQLRAVVAGVDPPHRARARRA